MDPDRSNPLYKRPAILILLLAALAGAVLLYGATTPTTAADKLFRHIPQMELKVVRIIDDDFDDIDSSDMKLILATALATYRDNFGVNNVRFVDAGRLSIEEFFKRHLNEDGEVFQRKDKRRFRIGEKNDFALHKESILKYLKKWEVEELKEFFPVSDQARYDTYQKIYQGTVEQMQSKIKFITSIKENGRSVLRSEKAKFRSFINWLTALETQNEYDVVLTNTFILYDDISQPQPHSIFTKCKVGGVSHKNLQRKTLEGRVIMGSTFGMDTRIDFFMEQGKSPISRNERNQVTGAYIIAHELGHAIFKLPDFYDHGPSCLLNNSRDLSYKEGYDLLIKNPGLCPKDKAWMEARSHFWDAEHAFNSGKWRDAVEAYRDVIKMTPNNLDGSRNRYMAQIAYKMSKAYFELGQMDYARRGAEMSIKLYRWEPKYADWLQRIDTISKPDPGGLQ